jgi:hypothetical protein
MPSFRVAERRVMDRSQPEGRRFIAFCWALESYVWLTRQRFHATYARLGAHLGFDWERKPTGAQMEAALALLWLERERVKAKRERANEARRAEKAVGRRAWDARRYAWVYDPDFLEVPHPAPAT